MFKKENKKKVVISIDKYQEVGVQKFSLRICVAPISATTASLTLAIVPLAKDDLKKRIPKHYSRGARPEHPEYGHQEDTLQVSEDSARPE